MGFSVIDHQSLAADGAELAVPLASASGIIGFGQWLSRNDSFRFDSRQRFLVALGFVTGGILFTGITAWIVFVVNLEGGQIDSLFPVFLNGIAIGIVGNGVLVALSLQFRLQKKQLQAHSIELEEKNERLGRLTSVLSHDLRNPLNVAQGHLTLMQESVDSEHIDAIDRSLDRIEMIITDTLALTQQTQPKDERESVALDSVARSAWETVETGDIDCQIEDLATLEADESRLRQAFENLFRNAIVHGGDQLTTIRVGRIEQSGFYIEDDGVGFSEDPSDEIFEWGMTSSSSGTGLGLAIVDEIIAAHGWSITATIGKEGGARFEITTITE
ncbi:PAS/PAC sensor signal transduction histidine kinase [Haloarcula argentinensis DSM 12282]|nr:PAS/PAC sensor signal transduction histidine kinase [Haloarcula argentinensis DSM 12282]